MHCIMRHCKRKSETRSVGLPDFLVTGGDALLVVSLWTPNPHVTGLLISVYATAAKTSLRNHNVSLVAASPTRHPGPLHCRNVQKKRQKNSPHSHRKQDLSIFPGQRRFQGFLTVDISGTASSFTAPCLSLSRIVLPK